MGCDFSFFLNPHSTKIITKKDDVTFSASTRTVQSFHFATDWPPPEVKHAVAVSAVLLSSDLPESVKIYIGESELDLGERVQLDETELCTIQLRVSKTEHIHDFNVRVQINYYD